jgi:hypothetical protein
MVRSRVRGRERECVERKTIPGTKMLFSEYGFEGK